MASPFINPWLPKTEKKPMGPTMVTSHPIPVITPTKIKASGMTKPVAPPTTGVKQTIKMPGFRPFSDAEKTQMAAGQSDIGGKIKKGLQMFIGDPIRAGIKAISRPKTLTAFLSGQTAEGIRQAVTEKPMDINITPKSGAGKATFGEEPITGIGGGLTGRVSKLAGQMAEKYKIPKGIAESGSQAAMLPFMLLAADPRVGPERRIAQEGIEKLVKEGMEKFGKEAVEKVLKSGGEEALTKLVKGADSIYKDSVIRTVGDTIKNKTEKVGLQGLLDADGEAISGLGSKIEKGAKSMTKGPIDVVDTGEGMMVLDGQHRAFEALQKGESDINANILTKDEAVKKYGDRIPGLNEALPDVPSTPLVDVPALPKPMEATNVPPPKIPEASVPPVAAEEPLGKWADNINLEKLNTPDDVKKMIKNVAEASKSTIDQSKRGVQKVATTKALAEQLGMTWADAVVRPIGKGHSAEELEAYHTLMLNQAEKLKAVEDSIIANPTDEAMVKYVEELNRYTLLQSSVHGARAETGRALNILKYMKSAAQDAPAKLQEDVIKKFGGQKMTKEIASHLISARKLAEETGSYQGYFDLIRRTQNPKFSDYAYEYWINAILSNPKTHIVNILSNTGQALKQVAERGVQAGIELARGKNKDVAFSEVGHMATGMLDGVNDGINRFLQVWKNGVTPEEVMKLDSMKLPVIGGKVGRVVRTPTTLLAAADEFFKAITSRSELYAQASRVARKEGLKGKAVAERMAEIIANPTDEILLAVKNHALEATFQQELGRVSSALLKARNLLPGARYVIPFVRTPTNIFKEAIKSTPLGFLNTAYKVYAGAPAEEITKSASKALLGTAVSIPVVMAFLNGKMTGSVPNDPAERDKFYRDGKKPMSVRIGNTWVSLSRMEPFATVVGMIGNVMENVKKGEKVTSQVADVVNAFSAQIEDKTFLQGISDLIQLATGRADEKSYLLKKLVIGTAAGFEPQLLAQIARSTDTTYRDVKDDSWLNQFVKTIKSRTPWLSQSVPSLLDTFGQEAKRTGGFIENMISPLERGKVTTDPVELELTRINTDITKPTRNKQVGGISGKLDVDAYRKYLKATGQVGHAMLVKMFALPEYQDLPQDDQVKAVETVMSKTRKGISELRAGELLLSLAGIRDVKNPAVLNDINTLYAEVIKTEEWKAMDDEEKLKLLLDNYATLSLRHSNDQGGGKQ